MRRLALAAVATLASALFAAPILAAPPADIDAYVAKTLATFDAPGFSLAIVEGDQTVLAKGYGVRRLGAKAPADAHTIFPIGSCTKAFVAAGLAILVDEGKLSWDDRVADRLPGFRMYDPYTTAEMTVRDLLAHNSGLSLGAGDMLWLGGSDYTRRGLMERLRYIKPARSFRQGYAYDNVLYAVAGLLVEQLSGMSWEDFTAKRILAPLGMRDATVPDAEGIASPNHARLHARVSGELRGIGPNSVLPETGSALDAPAIAPAGSIRASATDMAQWLKVQLARGALPGGKRLFSEEQSAQMWRPVTIEEPDRLPAILDARKPNFNLYALGWGIEDYRGHKVIEHTGGVLGGAAFVMLIPEKNVGIAAMVSSEDGATRRAVVYHLADHYLGLPQEDWIGKYRIAVDEILARGQAALKSLPGTAAGAAAAAPKIGPSLPLEKYAGKYEDAWYGGATVTYDGKALALQLDHTARFRSPLEHVQYDTFRTRFADKSLEDAYVTFALAADGTIDTMKLRPISPLADFSFNYRDFLFTPTRGPDN
jgi:CubicO group peptidase (beta-lactamase class C family)